MLIEPARPNLSKYLTLAFFKLIFAHVGVGRKRWKRAARRAIAGDLECHKEQTSKEHAHPV